MSFLLQIFSGPKKPKPAPKPPKPRNPAAEVSAMLRATMAVTALGAIAAIFFFTWLERALFAAMMVGLWVVYLRALEAICRECVITPDGLKLRETPAARKSAPRQRRQYSE